MSYDPEIVQPIRDLMTENGFIELKDADTVDSVLSCTRGVLLVFINSVCPISRYGRTALFQSLEATDIKPELLTTVFAGQDIAATERVREYIKEHPPSSPALALFLNGRLKIMLEKPFFRDNTEDVIVDYLIGVFEEYCK